MGNDVTRLFAERAWVAGGWARDVLLTVTADGRWGEIRTGVPAEQRVGATLLPGPVLPGLVNAHSHAFQRCIAGLTERRSNSGAGRSDDFWSWRERMYSVANRITPAQMEAIASFLYGELLAGGYAHVCEFHYLHNDIDGKPYADDAEMSLALMRAAQRSGIGLTLLPTLYMRSGFAAQGLREDQRRFASTPERLLRLAERIEREAAGTSTNVGLAFHSLRAVDPLALREVAAQAARKAWPVHIHIAEQTREVKDCLAQSGQRPIEWLLTHAQPDARWNLVHATHATADELAGVAQCGAAIVICPSTEANLGDGVFDLPTHAARQGRWSIGSDSHVTRNWPQELQLLEYSQRLTLRRRNIAAQVLGTESSAAAMFEAALAGGASATGRAVGGIATGERADFLVLASQAPSLLGLPADHLLDALVFSGAAGAISQTWVAGRCVASAGTPHADAAGRPGPGASDAAQRDAFTRAMKSLWSE